MLPRRLCPQQTQHDYRQVTIASRVDNDRNTSLNRLQFGRHCLWPTLANQFQSYAHDLISLPVATALLLYPGGQVRGLVAKDAIMGKGCFTGRLKGIGGSSGGSDIMDIVDGIAPTLEKGWYNQVTIKVTAHRGGQSTFKRNYFCRIVTS